MRPWLLLLAACGSAGTRPPTNRSVQPPTSKLSCPHGDALAALAKQAWASLVLDRDVTEVHCTPLRRRGEPYLWLTGVLDPGEFGPTITRALIAPDGKAVHTDLDRESAYDTRFVAKDLDGDDEDELVRVWTFGFDGSKHLEVIAPREKNKLVPDEGIDAVMGTFVNDLAQVDGCDMHLTYLPVGRGLNLAMQCGVRRVWRWTGRELVEVK